ncbi:hypothetical protein VTG60DRAFT_1079 [Thermothelomyces hinnuleus]
MSLAPRDLQCSPRALPRFLSKLETDDKRSQSILDTLQNFCVGRTRLLSLVLHSIRSMELWNRATALPKQRKTLGILVRGVDW